MCSVYIVCPSVLSCSNLKLHLTLEVKNIFIEENIMLQLTFNPGLTLTAIYTDLCQNDCQDFFNRGKRHCKINVFLGFLQP